MGKIAVYVIHTGAVNSNIKFREISMGEIKTILVVSKEEAVDTCRNNNYPQGGLKHWIRGAVSLSSKSVVTSLNVFFCVS